MLIDQDIVNMLSTSKQLLGEMYPIIVDYDGEVLSGAHRKQAGWQKTCQIDTRQLAEKWQVTPLMAKDMVRIHMNIQRKPTREETQIILLRMAKELEAKGTVKENVASELAKFVTYSPSWIGELLPDEYKHKEKVEAGAVGAKVLEQKRKTQETIQPEFVECDHCHVTTSLPTQWHGHVLCEGCFAKAELDPKGFDFYFRYLEKAKSPAVKPETWKPDIAKESWAYREARMKPQVSTFEVKFDVEAAKAGLPFGESHLPVCVRETVPDKTYQLPKGVLHVFFDGKTVHEGHEDRDEALRDVLRKRGETVLPITYERVTEEALQSAIEQVRAELLRLGWMPKEG